MEKQSLHSFGQSPETMRKLCVSCGNCAFPQIFHNRKLSGITVIYALYIAESIETKKLKK